ncbi:MAG TPA: DNA methyltransferase [Bryobacteraceae bacterium]|nr:DNA methyltransferase [Bryobacteraceae bacterium]
MKKRTTGNRVPSRRKQPAVEIYCRYSADSKAGTLYAGDALSFLQALGTDTAALIFLDPPFNLGKTYGSSRTTFDNRPQAEYETWLLQILEQCTRVLAPGGTLYLYHLPMWAMRLGSHLQKSLTFKHWIAISMKNGFVRGKRLYPAHYALLMFTKGAPAVFNRPKLEPALCRHCGKYVKDYGGYRPIIDAKGINLSDFWDDVSPVRHRNRKNRPANELPAVIFERVMKISANAEGLYVDPFAGAGGGALAAIGAGMKFKVCDIFRSNCALISKRIDQITPPPEAGK